MSAKERIRLDAMQRVKRGEITVVAASELMEVSLRQGRRLWKRFVSKGDAGLMHRLRGRASNRRLADDLSQRIIKRHQEIYADFGPTLACEKLAAGGYGSESQHAERIAQGPGIVGAAKASGQASQTS